MRLGSLHQEVLKEQLAHVLAGILNLKYSLPMIGKKHLERFKETHSIDENELESFNRYLQKDVQQ